MQPNDQMHLRLNPKTLKEKLIEINSKILTHILVHKLFYIIFENVQNCVHTVHFLGCK